MGENSFYLALLKESMDLLNVHFYILDMYGIVEYANANCCKVAGIPMENIIGMHINEVMAASGIEGPDLVENILKERKEIRFTGLLNYYGTQKRGMGIATPIFNGDELEHAAVLIWDAGDSVHVLGELLDHDNVLTMDQIMLDELMLLRSKQASTETFVAVSQASVQMLKDVDSIADVGANILITGESGVGKEVIADRIYNNSSRKGKPFIKVNCAAIPENLLEAEFFGYEKGAFTGAGAMGRAGYFELANHGYIFLDEIGDLPLALQSKLLRAIQQKEIYRLGSEKSIQLDVRIIAATNHDLKKLVDEGKFRADLYYRLNIVTFNMPPLRERPNDIVALGEFFLEKYCKKYGKTIYFSRGFKQKLSDYAWPGNVRELENVIERMVITATEGVLSAHSLDDLTGNDKIDWSEMPGLKQLTEEYERKTIEDALKEGKTAKNAARLLKVSEPTLSRKIRQYGLRPKNIANSY